MLIRNAKIDGAKVTRDEASTEEVMTKDDGLSFIVKLLWPFAGIFF